MCFWDFEFPKHHCALVTLWFYMEATGNTISTVYSGASSVSTAPHG